MDAAIDFKASYFGEICVTIAHATYWNIIYVVVMDRNSRLWPGNVALF